MSARLTLTSEVPNVEMLVNEERDTVTFVGDRSDDEATILSTEWLTVSGDVLIDLEAHR